MILKVNIMSQMLKAIKDASKMVILVIFQKILSSSLYLFWAIKIPNNGTLGESHDDVMAVIMLINVHVIPNWPAITGP